MNDDIELCESCHKLFYGCQLCTNEETKVFECIHCYVAWRYQKEKQKSSFCHYCNHITVEMYSLVAYNNCNSYDTIRTCGNCFETLLTRMATKNG